MKRFFVLLLTLSVLGCGEVVKKGDVTDETCR